MSKFQRILAAVDFSEVSVGALETALNLAGSLRAEIRVLHVVPEPVAALPLEGGAMYVEDVAPRLLNQAREDLARFLEDHASSAAGLHFDVKAGEPAAEINRDAHDWRADLIVLGTHGRSGISHLLMGSVAERVLREANVPVLCIRGGGRA